MEEVFKIYPDRLRDGKREELHLVVAPDFLDVQEGDHSFASPVKSDGEAYVSDSDLVLHFDVDTSCEIPCSVCGEPVKVGVNPKGVYQVVPLDEVKGAVYDFSAALREAILLETPQFAECNGGKCTHRGEMEPFLKKGEEFQQPFKDLELN